MTFRDLMQFSVGNLWRMKLRAFLTTSGVVIAIAAFTGMVSFGVGNQNLVEDEFEKMDLFSTMLVFPKDRDEVSDTGTVAELTAEMVDSLAALPGVTMAYPWDAFEVSLTFGDTTVVTEAQALPARELTTGQYSKVIAGKPPDTTRDSEILITERLLEILGIEDQDSLLDRPVILQTELLSIDSAVANLFQHASEHLPDRIADLHFDSLRFGTYRQRVLSSEMSEALVALSRGFFERPNVVAETVFVSGVLESRRGRSGVRPVVLTPAIARRLNTGGLGSDPTDLVAALKSGQLMQPSGDIGKTYARVTVKFERRTPYEPLKDTIEAMGFRVFSYAEEFQQIRRFFFYFDLALGAIGLIALATASLGIINTMLMAITERRREIGVIKSLGADERDIRRLFLVESAVIGAVGSMLGVFFGWVGTRIVSAIVAAVMDNEGLDPVDLFSTPLWLVALAFVFGVGVSLVAGLYPAARAARVDPVVALRSE